MPPALSVRPVPFCDQQAVLGSTEDREGHRPTSFLAHIMLEESVQIILQMNLEAQTLVSVGKGGRL